MNNYLEYVNTFNDNFKVATDFPLGVAPVCPRPEIAPDAQKVVIFAPHPDDECIQGALALRLFRESKMQVINVPVTYGSNVERKLPRLAELEGALNYLGWENSPVAEHGLADISPKGKAANPDNWQMARGLIREKLTELQPDLIIFPHELDWNGTHIGVNHLVMEALSDMPKDFACKVILTEYWGQLYQPNLMIELTPELVNDLVVATTFHIEEVKRNPYHLTIPAYFVEAVRRGGEVVGGQGGDVPDFAFADLYLLGEWRNGDLSCNESLGLVIDQQQDPWEQINS
jgi:LmbE family N-acetylglucosaminyl deacetylase